MRMILGKGDDTRQHGCLTFVFAYGLASIFAVYAYANPGARWFLWPLAVAAIIGRHVGGSPFVTVELGEDGLILRGLTRTVRISARSVRAVMFGSGEFSSASVNLWPREAYQPKERNLGSSRFVVLFLDRYYLGVGQEIADSHREPRGGGGSGHGAPHVQGVEASIP